MSKKHLATVQVEMLCIYSGGETTPGPGDVIEVDATEAARLIAIGAARPVKDSATGRA
jgi:hypothetical protein